MLSRTSSSFAVDAFDSTGKLAQKSDLKSELGQLYQPNRHRQRPPEDWARTRVSLVGSLPIIGVLLRFVTIPARFASIVIYS
ncbi:MAG: hypothetical protein NXI22_26060, partial [bacterium]|nr:hypothetical protein [bacterium]